MSQNNSWMGFIDGSWKTTKDGIRKGIGGFLMDQQHKVQYLFSGPLQNCSQGWEVELRALQYLCTSIKNRLGRDTSCCIATDCKSLHDDIHRSSANLRQVDSSTEYLQFINSMINTKVLLIKRTLNGEVDKLAKNGAARISMLSG